MGRNTCHNLKCEKSFVKWMCSAIFNDTDNKSNWRSGNGVGLFYVFAVPCCLMRIIKKPQPIVFRSFHCDYYSRPTKGASFPALMLRFWCKHCCHMFIMLDWVGCWSCFRGYPLRLTFLCSPFGLDWNVWCLYSILIVEDSKIES